MDAVLKIDNREINTPEAVQWAIEEWGSSTLLEHAKLHEGFRPLLAEGLALTIQNWPKIATRARIPEYTFQTMLTLAHRTDCLSAIDPDRFKKILTSMVPLEKPRVQMQYEAFRSIAGIVINLPSSSPLRQTAQESLNQLLTETKPYPYSLRDIAAQAALKVAIDHPELFSPMVTAMVHAVQDNLESLIATENPETKRKLWERIKAQFNSLHYKIGKEGRFCAAVFSDAGIMTTFAQALVRDWGEDQARNVLLQETFNIARNRGKVGPRWAAAVEKEIGNPSLPKTSPVSPCGPLALKAAREQTGSIFPSLTRISSPRM